MQGEQTNWKLDSWKSKPIKHQPNYADASKLSDVLGAISQYPPLVFVGEVENLKKQFADVACGKKFLLQGGDCAERFQDCNPEAITNKLKILLQMSVVLCYGTKKPVVRVGRIAGQYGKPRTTDLEKVGGIEIPTYKGDNINSFEQDAQARIPDPERLLRGYHISAMTLNYIRAMISGGFADLHNPENWNLGFVSKSDQKTKYSKIVDEIKSAIEFMESFGKVDEEKLGKVDFFTSHEGLLLGYESALTRYVEDQKKYYNLGAHMLWIGERTRSLTGAHVEYFRGIANPVGIKVGPTADADEINELIAALNPENEAGKIVLISRMGAQNVEKVLPNIIEKINAAKRHVLWSSDPMHGNIVKTDTGVKTRNFNDILTEVEKTFSVHKACKSILGGVHFELTGEDVTECTGGAEGLSAADLDKAYESFCDPRLNYSQSLEMAFLISRMI